MFASRTSRIRTVALVFVGLTATSAHSAEQMVRAVTGLNFALDRSNETLVFDLFGALWTMPAAGGVARALPADGAALDRPVISADGRWLAVEACHHGRCTVRLWDRSSGTVRTIGDSDGDARMPTFSHESRRIAYVSNRDGSDDIWEQTVTGSGLRKRSFAPAQERWPAYAMHGDELLWVSRDESRYQLMHAIGTAAGTAVYESAISIEAPSFRPDGSVIVFFESGESRRLRLLLNAEDGVVKTLLDGPRFEPQPLLWLNRDEALLSAEGVPQRYRFTGTDLEPLSLIAFVTVADHRPTGAARPVEPETANVGRYVLRVGGLLDPLTGTVSGPVDIVIDDHKVAEISPPRAHTGASTIVDDPTLIATPGLIAMVTEPPAAPAHAWLAAGATRVVCVHWQCQADVGRMIGIDPVLNDAERVAAVNDARASGHAVASSALYPDVAAGATLWLPAALSDSLYDDVASLLKRRQAAILLPGGADPFALVRQLQTARRLTDRVLTGTLGSPGAFSAAVRERLLAELSLAGDAAAALRALTVEAALEVGLADAGVIAAGKVADLLLVRGNPLTDASVFDAPVAIIRQGQFLTPSGLKEAAKNRQ
ncbi:MAG: hypothetical protein AAGH76_02450 [Pseudomonadota bacterium]